jgi:hypothetical protein
VKRKHAKPIAIAADNTTAAVEYVTKEVLDDLPLSLVPSRAEADALAEFKAAAQGLIEANNAARRVLAGPEAQARILIEPAQERYKAALTKLSAVVAPTV